MERSMGHYHPNGRLMDEGQFEKGKKAGARVKYDALGNKKDNGKAG
jgi:antitoxin component YwqK of YwqJK toxin-antitoxin module